MWELGRDWVSLPMHDVYGHSFLSIDPAPSNAGGLLNIALEVAAERRELLDRLRSALEECRDDEALSYARKLCGMEGDD